MDPCAQRRRRSASPSNIAEGSPSESTQPIDKPPPHLHSPTTLMRLPVLGAPFQPRPPFRDPLKSLAGLFQLLLLLLLAFVAGYVLRDVVGFVQLTLDPMINLNHHRNIGVHPQFQSSALLRFSTQNHLHHHKPVHPYFRSPPRSCRYPSAILANVGSAGIRFYHAFFAAVAAFHSRSDPSLVHHQYTPQTLQHPPIPDSGPDPGPGSDPVWWLADEQDDFYEREYVPRSTLWAIRDINRKAFFTGLCGHYRFNLSALPDISVVVTVQNEHDGMLSLSVHSVLARTPPTILREIIIVDDNGVGEVARAGVNETEFDDLKALPKVTVIHNNAREGCARSRLAGASLASAQVLVFIDSHVEMMSGTWAEHLLAPIAENPRTMALQTLDILSDLDHTYGDDSGDLLYGVITDQFYFGYQRSRFSGRDEEKPGRRVPYETPFGPGSLFAIRRDEFWRLGGYDKGLYVWGGENTELALKVWMCGGRLVMVPCSRVGHMYRIHTEQTRRWPPHLPQELTDRLGCGHEGSFSNSGSPADNFTKIVTRNNIRIMETWVGEHPAKYGYYKSVLGGKDKLLPPEWQQYVDEMEVDINAKEQREIRERNQCRDFEWFIQHVYKKLTGVRHPWQHGNAR